MTTVYANVVELKMEERKGEQKLKITMRRGTTDWVFFVTKEQEEKLLRSVGLKSRDGLKLMSFEVRLKKSKPNGYRKEGYRGDKEWHTEFETLFSHLKPEERQESSFRDPEGDVYLDGTLEIRELRKPLQKKK